MERDLIFAPGEPPKGADFEKWVIENFRQLGFLTQEYTHIRLKVLHAEPEKPREGMVVLADGSDWDPGPGSGVMGGAGVYAYYNSTWKKLG